MKIRECGFGSIADVALKDEVLYCKDHHGRPWLETNVSHTLLGKTEVAYNCEGLESYGSPGRDRGLVGFLESYPIEGEQWTKDDQDEVNQEHDYMQSESNPPHVLVYKGFECRFFLDIGIGSGCL